MKRFLLMTAAACVALPLGAQTGISLQKAIEIALSENVSIKVADKEIERTKYAKKGTYASLYPQLDASMSFQRTIEKQVMYMDGDSFDFGSMIGETLAGYLAPLYQIHSIPFPVPGEGGAESSSAASTDEGFSVGRWNTWLGGISASMPLVNAQLWESLKISGMDVELAVEKARGSRLEAVTQVKQAYYSVLLAKEANRVYREVYDNALANFNRTQMRFDAGKASQLDLARSATALANAVPNLYDSDNAVVLALWQLKAVMGIDLSEDIDTEGALADYAGEMSALYSGDDLSLEGNSSMKQLEIQANQLASAVKAQKYACLPSLAVAFSYSYNAMTNDFNFSEYKWTPYSYVGLSLSIPIFAGGRRASATKAAKVQQSELEIQRGNAERQLRISIRQYIGTMETAIRSFDASAKAVDASRKAYEITDEAFSVGSATQTDLNDAQLALIQSEMSRSQSIFSYLTARSGLEQTLGEDFIQNTTSGNE